MTPSPIQPRCDASDKERAAPPGEGVEAEKWNQQGGDHHRNYRQCLDTDDRIQEVKDESGSGLCNITRCCTEACPEHIGITDNAIIPLKERVVDRFYDPLMWLMRKLRPGKKETVKN